MFYLSYIYSITKEGKMRECNSFDGSKIDFFSEEFLQKLETFYLCC